MATGRYARRYARRPPAENWHTPRRLGAASVWPLALTGGAWPGSESTILAHNGLQRLSSTQHCRIYKETAPARAGAAWPGAAHLRGVLRPRYQHAIALTRPCPAEAGHGSAIAAEEQDSRNRIRRSSPLSTHYTPRADAHTHAPAAGAERCCEFGGLTRETTVTAVLPTTVGYNNHRGSVAGFIHWHAHRGCDRHRGPR